MKKDLCILSLTALCLLHQASPATAAGIGIVTGIRGEATVRRDPTPQAQALKFKDDVEWQDTLNTGADSRLRLLILQKSVITMKEQSQLQLREEAATPTQPKKKSVLNLLSGSIRAVVEKDALKDSDYEVQTSVAVAVIRGSDLIGARVSNTESHFFTGPGATATVTTAGVAPADMGPLTRAAVTPGAINITPISLDQFRSLAGAIAPKGAQANGHRAEATLASVGNRVTFQGVVEGQRLAQAPGSGQGGAGPGSRGPASGPAAAGPPPTGPGPTGPTPMAPPAVGPGPTGLVPVGNLVVPPPPSLFTQTMSGTFIETAIGGGRTNVSGSYSGNFNGTSISGNFLTGSQLTYVNASEATSSSDTFSGTLRGRFNASSGTVNLSSITFTESGHTNPSFSGSGSGVISGGILTNATLNGISFHDNGTKEADVILKASQSR